MSSGRGRLTRIALRHASAAVWESRFGLVSRDRRRRVFARRVRLAFEEAGTTFIKLGQLMSVRPDVFPPELVFELETLQDRVPALPPEVIRDVIVREFGASVDELFAEFDDVPIASASIAQVHRAVLRDAYRPAYGDAIAAGSAVAVKVVRPGVAESIALDVAALRPLALRLARTRRLSHVGIDSLLDEFSASMARECDLRIEGRTADRLGNDFADDPVVIVPRVIWPRTTRRVLTMEYVQGWRLSELDDAARAGIDSRALALHGAEAFLRQVLEFGRFHADLHPANLFVTPDGRICYLDFGIAGETTPPQRAAIAQVLVATVYRDADRALRYSAELGLVIPESKVPRIRQRVARLMEETLSAAPRDVRGFAIGFLRILDDERIGFPAQYGLLVKALVTVEGVARSLHPDIDIVEAAGEFATARVARELMRPERLAKRIPDAVRAAIEELAR